MSPLEAKARLHDQAIAPSTLKQYNTRVTRIEEFLREMNAPFLSKDIFYLYIGAIDALSQPAKCFASQARSAVLHLQQSRDMWCSPTGHCWAKDTDVIRACKGFVYKAKGRTIPRGQITPEMFKDFITFLERHHPKFVHPSIVLYGTGLRIGALTAIKREDFDPELNQIRFPNKAASATNALPTWATKQIKDPDAIEVLQLYQRLTQPSQLLFNIDRCPIIQFRAVIKQAATVLKWDAELNFDGPHTLRHGATIHLQSFADNNRELQEIIGMSPTTLKAYSRSNAERKRLRTNTAEDAFQTE